MPSCLSKQFVTRLISCLIIDVDECLLTPCEQLCNDTEGSFTCSCEDGYRLNDDGRTCDGTLLATVLSTRISFCIGLF